MATQPLFDMSKAQPVTAPLFDMSKAQAISTGSAPDPRSLLDHLANDPNNIPLDSGKFGLWDPRGYVSPTLRGFANIGQGTAQAIQGTAALLNPKAQDENEKSVAAINPLALPVYRLFRGLGHTAEDAQKLAKAYHESGGPTLAEIGDVSGVGAGNLIPAIAASPEGLSAVRGAASDAASSAAKAANAAPNLVNKTAGAVRAVDPDVVGIFSPRAASALRVAQRAAKVAQKYTREAGPEAEAEATTAPAAASPQSTSAAAPPKTLSDLSAGAPSKVTPAKVESLLNDSLGAKPLEKNVPLRDQLTPSKTASASLPDGFTAVKSSVLKGYKYDPATQELEAITNSGSRYRTGEVSADQFKEFEATDSKGTAWNKLRGNSTPLGKYVGDKFVPYQRAGLRTATPDEASSTTQPKTLSDLSGSASPATPSGAGDNLLAQLQKSLENQKAKKLSDLAGVETNLSPSRLADRWGVDEESLAAGREQTRGMSADETEESVSALVERYKKGEAVDPVIEYRDADNNITDVDGRARVIAAKRAGIKRIPLRVVRATAAGGGQ